MNIQFRSLFSKLQTSQMGAAISWWNLSLLATHFKEHLPAKHYA